MANGDPTDDDPSMGQGQSPGGAPPGGPPGGGGGAPGGPPQPGGALAFMARNKMGPQVSAPGPGNMADSMTLLNQAIQMIQHAALGLPPGSPLHRDALQSASKLSRHLGGTGSFGAGAGVQKTAWQDQLRQTIRNMMLSRMQSSAAGGSKQGGGDAAQGPAQAPMPSTPLPGS